MKIKRERLEIDKRLDDVARRLSIKRRRAWRLGKLTNDYPIDRELALCAMILAFHYPEEMRAEFGGEISKAIYGAIALGDFLVIEEARAHDPKKFTRWLQRWKDRAGVDDEFIATCRASWGNYVHVRGRLVAHWGMLFSFGRLESNHQN